MKNQEIHIYIQYEGCNEARLYNRKRLEFNSSKNFYLSPFHQLHRGLIFTVAIPIRASTWTQSKIKSDFVLITCLKSDFFLLLVHVKPRIGSRSFISSNYNAFHRHNQKLVTSALALKGLLISIEFSVPI